MGYVGQGDATAHSTAGLVLDLHAGMATGTSAGINSPATTVWQDLSGNGKNGTLANFAYTIASGWDTDGLVFDGIDDKLTCSNPQTSVTSATFEFWLNAITDTTTRYFWGSGFWIRYTNTTLTAYINSQYCTVNSFNVGGANRHIVVTFSTTDGIKIFVDNVLKASNTTVTSTMTLGATISLMALGATYAYGKLYAYRQYNKVLSGDEIAQNYNAGITWDAGTVTPNYYSYIIAP